MIKYRGKRIDNGALVYGFYRENSFYNRLGDEPVLIYTKHFIGVLDNLQLFDIIFEQVEVEKDSISIFFGKKDKNGKEIYTKDIVKYKGKEYQVRYFEEYGAFGLYDEEYNRPLGRSGSSTKYEPYFMNEYHTKQMEVI
jgi:hypothetical protein